MSESDLKPCPFCGSTDIREGEVEEEETTIARLYFVECGNCGARVEVEAWEAGPEGARAKWNQRATN